MVHTNLLRHRAAPCLPYTPIIPKPPAKCNRLCPDFAAKMQQKAVPQGNPRSTAVLFYAANQAARAALMEAKIWSLFSLQTRITSPESATVTVAALAISYWSGRYSSKA